MHFASCILAWSSKVPAHVAQSQPFPCRRSDGPRCRRLRRKAVAPCKRDEAVTAWWPGPGSGCRPKRVISVCAAHKLIYILSTVLYSTLYLSLLRSAAARRPLGPVSCRRTRRIRRNSGPALVDYRSRIPPHRSQITDHSSHNSQASTCGALAEA